MARRKKKKNWYNNQYLLFALGGVLIIFSFAWASQGSVANTAAEVGRPAPDFTLTALSGESVQLSSYLGRPVLINFWATWCPPCRLEMPTIIERYNYYQPDLVVLAVDNEEPASLVASFAVEFGLPFDPLLDSTGSVADLYQVQGLPVSFFIDRDGVIQAIHAGILTDYDLDINLALIGLTP